MPELRRISLNPFLGGDATRLLQAREEAARLHASGDIRAAENQVEVQARKIFRRRPLSPLSSYAWSRRRLPRFRQSAS